MNDNNWLELLDWKEEQIQDIRFAGYSFIKQGKYEEALKFFESLLALDIKSFYDLHTLGSLYLQLGNNLSALNYIEQALKLQNDHEPTQLNRSKALLLLGYKKQGLVQANQLEKSSDSYIANQARALVLSYS